MYLIDENKKPIEVVICHDCGSLVMHAMAKEVRVSETWLSKETRRHYCGICAKDHPEDYVDREGRKFVTVKEHYEAVKVTKK